MSTGRESIAQHLASFAGGELPELCVLDGGPGARSVIGARPLRELRGDSLALLDEIEALWRREPERRWIGWLSYDLGAGELLARPPRRSALPQLVARQFEQVDELAPRRASATPGDWPLAALEPTIAPAAYRERVRAAQRYIHAGDSYQINLSQRLRAPWSAELRAQPLAARIAALYGQLRARTPASMGALIAVDSERAIVSNSPETLLELRMGEGRDGGDLARSWPIKGTRPRHADPRADAEAIAELRASVKDRAEHVMIVDLVRNDLGRLARAGSVSAPRQPSLVSLPTVHHLVSEVACTLAPGWTLRGLFRALFPGGSITGAPKRRTVAIIDELEGEARGIYCGALLLLEPRGLRVSIPIRTGVLDDAGLELRSGGGIVADSDPESERLETLAKARAFDRARW